MSDDANSVLTRDEYELQLRTIYRDLQARQVPVVLIMDPDTRKLSLEFPGDGGEVGIINHYTCPTCQHPWTDEWNSEVDDDCPNCGERHITPHTSEQTPEYISEGIEL